MRWWTPMMLALLALGCPREEAVAPDAGATDTGAERAEQARDGAEGESMLPSSILPEDDFKALHRLKREEAPPHQGRMVELDGSRAYLSMAEMGAGSPGILLIHEWWGLNEHIKHWADRLAEAGYTALAVDLFGGRTTEDAGEAVELVRSVDAEQALPVLRAGQRYLTETEGIEASNLGVIGWCFGGAWALRAGIELENLDAVVMYYGRLVHDPEELRRIDAPLLAVFGEEDPSLPPEEVDRFVQALKEAGVDHRVLRYEAEHAFANPSQESYDTDAAREAWAQVKTFLADQLKEPVEGRGAGIMGEDEGGAGDGSDAGR